MHARFTLDEPRARDVLAAAMARCESPQATEGDWDLQTGLDYDPKRWEDNASDTAAIVTFAADTGLITGPGTIYFEFARGDGDWYYWWSVSLTGLADATLDSFSRTLDGLGSASAAPGPEAALAVLSEAVASANHMLNCLDAYHHQAPTTPSHGEPGEQ